MNSPSMLGTSLKEILFALVIIIVTGITVYTVIPYVSHQVSLFWANPLEEVKLRQREEAKDVTNNNTNTILDEIAKIEYDIRQRKAMEESGEIKKVKVSDIIEKRESMKKAAVCAGRQHMLETNEQRNNEIATAIRAEEKKSQEKNKINAASILKRREGVKRPAVSVGHKKLLQADKNSTMSLAEVMELQEHKRNRLLIPSSGSGSISGSISGSNSGSGSTSSSSAERDIGRGRGRDTTRVQDEVSGYNVVPDVVEVLAGAHMYGLMAGGTETVARAEELARERTLVAEQNAAYHQSLQLDRKKIRVDSLHESLDQDEPLVADQAVESEELSEEAKIEEKETECALVGEEPETTDAGAVTIQFQIKLTRRKQLANQLASTTLGADKDTVKKSRRFVRTALLADVVRYIRSLCRELGTSKSFEVIRPYPKQILFSTNHNVFPSDPGMISVNRTLEDLQLVGKCVLYVHPVSLEL